MKLVRTPISGEARCRGCNQFIEPGSLAANVGSIAGWPLLTHEQCYASYQARRTAWAGKTRAAVLPTSPFR